MSSEHPQFITDPAAWTSAELGGKAGLERRLSTTEIHAIDELLGPLRDTAPTSVRREEFSHPAIDALMTEVVAALMKGRGAVVLSGLDISRYDLADFERIYWGLGTHIGRGAVQSPRGDRLGYVQTADNPGDRAYLRTDALKHHCDFHEIVGLACFERAEEGGLSGLVSGLAIHNVLLGTKPQLLRPLYEGFWHGLNVKEEMRENAVSLEKVPIFSERDGLISCFYHSLFMDMGARQQKTSMPDDLVAALVEFDRLATDENIALHFMLEPGEIFFWHNFIHMHSRTEFRNSAVRKRLLLRLWLNSYEHRPAVEAITNRARLADKWYGT